MSAAAVAVLHALIVFAVAVAALSTYFLVVRDDGGRS